MNRSEFLRASASFAPTSCAMLVLGVHADAAESSVTQTPVDEVLKKAQYENQFATNWLADLFATIDTVRRGGKNCRLVADLG